MCGAEKDKKKGKTDRRAQKKRKKETREKEGRRR